MHTAWEGAKREWDELKAQHNELQVSLTQRRLDAERLHEGVARESATLLTELQAERRLLASERDICRGERTALSKCLIEHRTEVSRHRDDVFHKMQELASQREQHTRSEQIPREQFGPRPSAAVASTGGRRRS